MGNFAFFLTLYIWGVNSMKKFFFLVDLTEFYPAAILYYSFLPLMTRDLSLPFYSVTILNMIVWIVLLRKEVQSKIGYSINFFSLILVVFTYQGLIFDFLMSVLMLFTLLSPFLMRRFFSHDRWMLVLVYLFDIIIIYFFVSIILLFVEKGWLPFFTQGQYINFFVVLIILVTAVYTLKHLFNFLYFLIEKKEVYSNNIIVIFITIGIPVFLSLPDIVFSYSIYELYLEVYKGKEYSFLDRYYYSFSVHFLTPPFKLGLEIQRLFDSSLGKVIYISHMLTVRIVDITLIAAISSIFIDKIRNKEKGKL